MTEETYRSKIEKVATYLMNKNGSFSAGDVLGEMRKRGWASPLDSMLDIHKLLVEIYGDPGKETKSPARGH